MDNKIKENIAKLIKNTKNPQTGEFFKIDDEVNIIVREKHVTITIQIDHQKLDLFKEVNSYLKEQIDSNKDILSSNIICASGFWNSALLESNPEASLENTSHDPLR